MMMQKLNLSLKSDASQHSFMLMMDDITQASCKSVIEWILEANFAEQKPEMLNLIISSPGGELESAFALIDVMRGSSIPIRTIGLGIIASAGLAIFVAGEKGQRVLTPNTAIMSHQYTSGSYGKEHELFASIKMFDLTTSRCCAHYKKFSTLNEKQVREILLPAQDVWLTPTEAKKYGLCDAVKDLS